MLNLYLFLTVYTKLLVKSDYTFYNLNNIYYNIHIYFFTLSLNTVGGPIEGQETERDRFV